MRLEPIEQCRCGGPVITNESCLSCNVQGLLGFVGIGVWVWLVFVLVDAAKAVQ